MSLAAPKLTFTPATLTDAEFLLRIRNDAATRAASVNQEPVALAEHMKWLDRVIGSQTTKLYVAHAAQQAVGSVRLDARPARSCWELSWTIAPECRGKGLGKEMVRQAADFFDVALIARIKPDNDASKQIARHAGFEPAGQDDGCEIWQRRHAANT